MLPKKQPTLLADDHVIAGGGVEDFIGEQVIQVHQPGAEAEMIIVIAFVFFYVQKGMPGIEGWFFGEPSFFEKVVRFNELKPGNQGQER